MPEKSSTVKTICPGLTSSTKAPLFTTPAEHKMSTTPAKTHTKSSPASTTLPQRISVPSRRSAFAARGTQTPEGASSRKADDDVRIEIVDGKSELFANTAAVERRRAGALFPTDDGLPRNADPVGKFFLRKVERTPKIDDLF